MRYAALAFVAAISATPAFGFTGAEYLRSDNSFRSGFAWGIATYQTQITGALSQDAAQSLMDCFVRGNISSTDFGNAVARYIENNPDTMSINAISAVIRTSRAMCPEIQ